MPPGPMSSRRSSNWGLIRIRKLVPGLAQAAAGARTFETEMKETSATTSAAGSGMSAGLSSRALRWIATTRGSC